MSSAYSVTPTSGINLGTTVTTNANSANVAIPTIGPLGLQVFGSDGKRYVLGQASATIASGTTTCIVSPSTFAVTYDAGTAGTYTSPSAVALTAGQYAWFGKASV